MKTFMFITSIAGLVIICQLVPTFSSVTYKADCSLTRFPDFDDIIVANPKKFVLHISIYPISYTRIRNIAPVGGGKLQEIRTKSMIDSSSCVLIIDTRDTHGSYPNWDFWQNATGVSRHLDTVTILQIYCPLNTSWNILNNTFPIQGLTSLILLSLECPIQDIHESFFRGLTKLFYFSLRSSVLMTVDQNTFTHVPNLAFVSTHWSLPVSNLTFDTFCPLSRSLEYLSIYSKSRYSFFYTPHCNKTFDKVTYITAHDYQLQNVTNTTFMLFPNLRYLLLWTPSLEHIAENSFRKLTLLYSLIIGRGNIKTPNIPEITQNLTKLYLIFLDSDNISKINGKFSESIRYIYLPNNSITYIPNNTFINTANLLVLNLTHNNIKVIESGTFQSLYSTFALDISHNSIILLEHGCFKRLYMIRKLDISHNLIHHLTSYIFESSTTRNFRKLSKIVLAINKTTIKNYTFTSLATLVNLDISYNLITNIDEDTLKNLPNLRTLDLRNNKITHLAAHTFHHVPKLRYLDLSYNQIGHIPNELLHNLPALSALSLASNRFSTLPCKLVTSHTKATMCNLQLIGLYLENNRLKNNALCFLKNKCALPEQTQLPNLRYLSIHNNSITYINASHLHNLRLDKFSFNDNPFKCSCDLVPFGTWIQSHASVIDNNGRTPARCTTNVSYTLETLPHVLACDKTIYRTTTIQNYPIIIALCVCILIAIVIGSLCWYFRMEIAAKTGLRLRRHNPEFRQKWYNVMIWCHDRDIGYANNVVQTLERVFTVYWNQRDSIPGEPTELCFERGIKSCERVIVILTRNFVIDYHCQLKFESLHISIGKRDFSAVLIVADDDVIAHKQRLYERIRAYLRTRQYLRHDDRLFWRKLFYKLPPLPEDAEAIVYADLVNPHIDFDGQRPLGEMLEPPRNNDVEMDEVNVGGDGIVGDDLNPNNVFMERLGQDIDGYDADRLI